MISTNFTQPPQEPSLPSGVDAGNDPLTDCLLHLCTFYHPPAGGWLAGRLPLVNDRLSVELFARAAERAWASAPAWCNAPWSGCTH